MAPRNIKTPIPPADLDLISRLLRFANLKRIDSQDQIYALFFSHQYAACNQPLPDDGVLPMKVLNQKDGVKPFINDQEMIKAQLGTLDSEDPKIIDGVQYKAAAVLGEKLKAYLKVGWERKQLRIVGEPVLDGIEVFIWYPVALIFHHNLEKLVKVCKLQLESNTTCGNFFLYTPELRKYCSPEHAERGKPQAVLAAIKNWQATHPEKARIKITKRSGSRKITNGRNRKGGGTMDNAKLKKGGRHGKRK